MNNSIYQEAGPRTITPEHFPDEGKHDVVWMCWKDEGTKVPKIPGTRHNARTNLPGDLRSYEEAVKAYEANPDYYDGVAVVFQDDDPYFGIDLDGCRDPETGVIDPWAREIIENHATYSEVSPSKTGIKMWGIGRLPFRQNSKKFVKGERPGIEVYDGGKWFAVTGWHLEGTPRVFKRRQSEVTKLIREHWPEKFAAPKTSTNGNGNGSTFKAPGDPFNLEKWLEDFNVPVSRETSDNQGRKWKLAECPRADRHSTPDTSGAYVGQMHGDNGSPYGPVYARCSHAGCGGGDQDLWHDLRQSYEPSWEPYQEKIKPGKRTRQSKNGSHRADSSDSSDSFSKGENLISTPEFPVDALPTGCARYIKEASASLSCDPALVGVPVLAALSGVIGYSREIRIKPGWTESASLYLGVVDEPGSRKSPAASLAYKPLEKLQATLRKAYKEEKKVYEEQMRRHVVAKKNAAKEGEPEPEPPVAPVMRRCIVDDITIEALAMRLEQNPRGFLSHQDEFTGFLRGMDQYKSGGKGNTRQSYLKIWSNRPIYVDRKGSDEPVVVPKPALTLQGGIQPSVLHEIADGRDDGFLDRFDFAYPEPGRGGYSEDTVSFAAQSAYENVIGSLWDRGPHQEDERTGELVPVIVRMDPEAKTLFVSEANNLSREMAEAGFPKVLRGPWSKFDTKLARLALIISLARCAEENPEVELVTTRDMEAALRLLNYFKATTRKVYGQLFEANPDDVLAADIKTLLTKTGYVFIGSISELMDVLESEALPDSPESLGRALRRIVKATPEMNLESKPTGDKRVITLRLEKPSEPSELSDKDDEVEVGI